MSAKWVSVLKEKQVLYKNTIKTGFAFLSRPDRQLQDIVYKMVPFLEECKCLHVYRNLGDSSVWYSKHLLLFLFTIAEREKMCNFYKERGLPVPKSGKVLHTVTELHTKRPSWGLNRRPSCCEAAVLTTSPICSLCKWVNNMKLLTVTELQKHKQNRIFWLVTTQFLKTTLNMKFHILYSVLNNIPFSVSHSHSWFKTFYVVFLYTDFCFNF